MEDTADLEIGQDGEDAELEEELDVKLIEHDLKKKKWMTMEKYLTVHN